MASLAPQRRSVGGALGHAVLKFAVMRIGVTRGATPVFEMERHNLVGVTRGAFFVTAHARHHGVSPFQRVSCLPMHGDRKFRPVKIDDAVAVFTAIRVFGVGKLPGVRVLVAIRAL